MPFAPPSVLSSAPFEGVFQEFFRRKPTLSMYPYFDPSKAAQAPQGPFAPGEIKWLVCEKMAAYPDHTLAGIYSLQGDVLNPIELNCIFEKARSKTPFTWLKIFYSSTRRIDRKVYFVEHADGSTQAVVAERSEIDGRIHVTDVKVHDNGYEYFERDYPSFDNLGMSDVLPRSTGYYRFLNLSALSSVTYEVQHVGNNSFVGRSFNVLGNRIFTQKGRFSAEFELVGAGYSSDFWCVTERPQVAPLKGDCLQLTHPIRPDERVTLFRIAEIQGEFVRNEPIGEMLVQSPTCRYTCQFVNGRPVSGVSQVFFPSGRKGFYQVDPNQLYQQRKLVYVVNQETGERTLLMDAQKVSEVDFFRQAITEAPLLLALAVKDQPYPALQQLAIELLAFGAPVHHLFGAWFSKPLKDEPTLRFIPEMGLVKPDGVVTWLDALLGQLDSGVAASDLIEALRFLSKLYFAASQQVPLAFSDIQPPTCCEASPLLKKRPARPVLSELERQAAFETLCRTYWPWVLTRLWLIRETYLAADQANHPLSEGIGHFFEEARKIKMASLEKALAEEVPAEEAAARQAMSMSFSGHVIKLIADHLLAPQHKKNAENLFNEARQQVEEQREADKRERLAKEALRKQERARVARLAQAAKERFDTLVAESSSWIEESERLKREWCDALAQDVERLKAANLEAKRLENQRKKAEKKVARVEIKSAANRPATASSSSDLGGTPISAGEACQLGASPLEVLTREEAAPGYPDSRKKVHRPYSSSAIRETVPHRAPLFRTTSRGRCLAVHSMKACYSGEELNVFLNQRTDIPQNIRAGLHLTTEIPVSILLTIYNSLIKEAFFWMADFSEQASIMRNSPSESELQQRLASLPAGSPRYAELKAKMRELMTQDNDDVFAEFLNYQQSDSLLRC